MKSFTRLRNGLKLSKSPRRMSSLGFVIFTGMNVPFSCFILLYSVYFFYNLFIFCVCWMSIRLIAVQNIRLILPLFLFSSGQISFYWLSIFLASFYNILRFFLCFYFFWLVERINLNLTPSSWSLASCNEARNDWKVTGTFLHMTHAAHAAHAWSDSVANMPGGYSL